MTYHRLTVYLFFPEKTEYDILKGKSSFEDVDDEKNADYSTLVSKFRFYPFYLYIEWIIS